VRSEIKELHQRLKTTTIYVTHDQIEAMTMADKIVVMRDGVIEQVGAPLELYDRPVSTFVASFIGSPAMNLLNGTMTSAGFDIGEGVVLPCPSPNGVAIYGVRPEHIQLDAACLPAEIVVVEPTGAETQVVLRLGGQTLTAAFRERIEKGPGEILSVRPEPGAIHLFDQSGARLNCVPRQRPWHRFRVEL
jgi:multiple sugar transport system ATP-binding protein